MFEYENQSQEDHDMIDLDLPDECDQDAQKDYHDMIDDEDAHNQLHISGYENDYAASDTQSEDLDLDLPDHNPEPMGPECVAYLDIEAPDTDMMTQLSLCRGDEITVGRSKEKCTYVISDDRVSKEHFRLYSIVYEDEPSPEFSPLVYCQDLESFNGTFVNGQLIGKITQEKIGYLLSDGDVIEIQPSCKFIFNQQVQQTAPRSKDVRYDLRLFDDQYDLSDRLLGFGRCGRVYLANDTVTSKQVACKIIEFSQTVQNSQQLETPARGTTLARRIRDEKLRCLREVRILATLSHPHILNLKKAFCSPKALYLFTELATGGDLFSYLQAHGGRLSEYNARFLVRQIAQAVQYLHSNDIAHRDIKPENVLVSHTYYGGRAVLTDFGMAISVNSRDLGIGNGTGTSRMTSKIGTDGYAAPEIALHDEDDDRSYTISADMWSLGILTMSLLIGEGGIPRQQLCKKNPVDAVDRYGANEDTHLNDLWVELPSRARGFLHGLLMLDPDARMTADAALEHAWFTKPRGEAEALMRAVNSMSKFWVKRDADTKILEGIGGEVLSPTTPSIDLGPRIRQRIPNMTNSPYFGLDRHLTPRMPSTRQDLLETLSQSGAPFVQTKKLGQGKFSKSSTRRMEIQRVNGSDIFGKSLPKSDEVDLIPTAPSSETVYGISFSDPPTSPSAMAEAYETTTPSMNKKRVPESNSKKTVRYLDPNELRNRMRKMSVDCRRV